MELDWSLDFCLACDRLTEGEAYCCQNCRLADLTISCSPAAVSPKMSLSTDSSSAISRRHHGLQLEPAFDFCSHRTAPPASSEEKSQKLSSLRSPSSSNSKATVASLFSDRIFTPSSSRSSLDLCSSKASLDTQLSHQARTALRGYANSFDVIRNWRRQMASP